MGKNEKCEKKGLGAGGEGTEGGKKRKGPQAWVRDIEMTFGITKKIGGHLQESKEKGEMQKAAGQEKKRRTCEEGGGKAEAQKKKKKLGPCAKGKS